jgi:hypothetical protein
MEMKIEVSEYDQNGGLEDRWIGGYQISVKVDKDFC